MSFSRAGQLARPVPTARLTDSLGLVAENLRSSPHGVVPVLDRPTWGEGDPSEREARVIGLIDVRDLARVSEMILAPVYANGHGNLNGNAPAPNFDTLTAREVMRADVPHIQAAFSLHNALLTLDRYDLPALPVLDEAGRYRGLISRADVLAALGNHIRPPLVGGMATPLGVWLTNGHLNGGAPTLGLFLSGLALAGCYAFATVLLTLIFWLIDPNWSAAALSGRLGIALDGSGALNSLAFFGHALLFLLALRAIPMAGIHAAEHQTVWALERGLPLEIEYVEKMPRAHPRCGTNLMALVGLVTIGFAHLPDYGPNWVLLVLVATFFGWRNFGTLLQEWFTTRPASKKQLESGIKAARELMEKYQAEPFASPASPLTLLNNGMIFSALGMILGISAFFWGFEFVAAGVVSGEERFPARQTPNHDAPNSAPPHFPGYLCPIRPGSRASRHASARRFRRVDIERAISNRASSQARCGRNRPHFTLPTRAALHGANRSCWRQAELLYERRFFARDF